MMRTSLRSPFNSNRTSLWSENIPGHSVIRKIKKEYGLKYFSRQAIRCEILAIMELVDARKSTIDPVNGSQSRSSSHYVANASETKFQAVSITPRPEMSNSFCASFHVMSSLIICTMTFFSLHYFILEQMTQYIIHFRISIKNFWLTLYAASDLVSAIVSIYIIGYKVMFVTSTLFIFFCTHLSAFKGSNNHRGNKQRLLPHIPEATKTRKPRKMRMEKLERSCRLILEDILYTINDAQKIEVSCIVIGIAVSWRALYGLFFYVVHRFYSKKDRE